MRIELSAYTWIEDGYLRTTSRAVMEGWRETHERISWMKKSGADLCFCIPLTVAAKVYKYREGEPWVRTMIMLQYGRVGRVYECGIQVVAGGPTEWEYYLHRRVAGVCDTTEQFRALYDALKEVRDV